MFFKSVRNIGRQANITAAICDALQNVDVDRADLRDLWWHVLVSLNQTDTNRDESNGTSNIERGMTKSEVIWRLAGLLFVRLEGFEPTTLSSVG